MKNKFLVCIILLLVVTMFSLIGCTLNKVEKCDISTLNIYSTIKSIEYTGNAIYPEVHLVDSRNEVVAKVKHGYSGNDFEIFYYDNVKVGKAKILVKAKEGSEKYTGEASIYFDIIPSSKAIANTKDELINLLENGTASKITLSNDIEIASDMHISIPSDVILYLGGYTLTNNGKIDIVGTLDCNTVDKASIVNNGEIYVDNADIRHGKLLLHNGNLITSSGQITFATDRVNINFPKDFRLFSDSPIKTKEGSILFNADDESKKKGIFVRQPLDNYEIKINPYDATYNGSEKKPGFTAKLGNSQDNEKLTSEDYVVEYSDNINAGIAKMVIKATPLSRYLLGEKIITYDISKATIDVDSTNLNQLDNYLNNDNYSEIRLNCMCNDDITIPNWAKLIVSFNEISKNVKNDGTLVIIPTKNKQIKVGNIVNNGTIDIDESAKVIVGNAITGNGNIDNHGKLFLPSESSINATNINNLGSIYYNVDEQLNATIVGNNPYKRTKIGSENVVLTNDYEEYDGYRHNTNVDFLLDGNVVNVDDCEYSVNQMTSPIDAGEYECIVQSSDVATYFYGETSLIYHVKKASITIDGSGTTLAKALISQNYDDITLATNETLYAVIHIVVPNDTTITIAKDAELCNDTYVEDGKIHTILELKGKIINNGKYKELGLRNLSLSSEADEQNSSLEIGTFINNGEAYLNRVKPENKSQMTKYVPDYPTSIKGTTYIREHLDATTVEHIEDIPFTVQKAQGSMYVDYNKLRPELTIYASDGTKLINKQEELIDNQTTTTFVDYVLSYENWRNVSVEGDTAKVIIKAKDSSKKVYGTREVNYNISEGTVDVANYSELEWALTSVHPRENICNFALINVVDDILYDRNKETTLTVYQNTKLRCGRHRMRFFYEDDGYISTTYYCHLRNDGEVYTSSSLINFSVYPVKGQGTYIGEIYQVGDLEDLSNIEFIHVMDDIDGTIIISPNNREDFNSTQYTNVYLNGHTINNLELGLSQRNINVNGRGVVNNLYVWGAHENKQYMADIRGLKIGEIKYATNLEKQFTIIS